MTQQGLGGALYPEPPPFSEHRKCLILQAKKTDAQGGLDWPKVTQQEQSWAEKLQILWVTLISLGLSRLPWCLSP